MNPHFDSRFAQRVDTRINEDLMKYREDLGAGKHIIRDDAAATGMNSLRFVGIIEGLEIGLKHLREVHEEMNSRAKKETKD